MTDTTQALSFGAAAGEYDRFRPGYPAPAVAWAVGTDGPARVVDLGAGTGILSRVLLGLGHTVTPVEPDPGMRAQLAAATPGTTALSGSAEAVPLPDGWADAVVAGQAYHWFDRERAHPEIARLLRPGGMFAPIWNIRDDSVDWVAALSRIVGGPGYRAEDSLGQVGDSFGDRFGPVERAEFRHHVTLGPEQLLGMLRTRSYHLTADATRQRELDRAVRELTTDHPDLAGRDSFALPYRTIVVRAARRAD
ncbi:class I SAM-dependent methyltransferase [Micromonospora echinofusca]|uniref:Methyltransferase domain-containing protein n=1 Tax=Micromonospora echinofusca TaxID=47858 RepID=A0ABS3VMY7_MICEH|nr:class I SAM-dependent methyltransferase [Micromonospora echinofusca]MBO4205914.1 methyltransferase domain-containing protein [Micromonospora echinofusca]